MRRTFALLALLLGLATTPAESQNKNNDAQMLDTVLKVIEIGARNARNFKADHFNLLLCYGIEGIKCESPRFRRVRTLKLDGWLWPEQYGTGPFFLRQPLKQVSNLVFADMIGSEYDIVYFVPSIERSDLASGSDAH